MPRVNWIKSLMSGKTAGTVNHGCHEYSLRGKIRIAPERLIIWKCPWLNIQIEQRTFKKPTSKMSHVHNQGKFNRYFTTFNDLPPIWEHIYFIGHKNVRIGSWSGRIYNNWPWVRICRPGVRLRGSGNHLRIRNTVFFRNTCQKQSCSNFQTHIKTKIIFKLISERFNNVPF